MVGDLDGTILHRRAYPRRKWWQWMRIDRIEEEMLSVIVKQLWLLTGRRRACLRRQ